MQIGSLADWVSGLGTAGSLLLGFTILLRDRRKADQTEATQVVTWFVNLPDHMVDLNVTNGSDRPIVHVMFCLASVDERGKRAARWRMLNLAPVLVPGEGKSLTIPFSEFHANGLWPSYVQFRDANGLNWRRNVRSGKLRKARTGLTWRQRFMLLKSPRKAIIRIKTNYRRW